MKKVFSFLLLSILALSIAQETIVVSPQAIVVNPKPSFGVEVFADRDPSGDSTPTYQIGENISIGVRVTETSYVYLFNIRSTGEVQQILPNRFDSAGQNNLVQAGETKFFPPRDARYTFDIAAPGGIDKIIAVASKDPLDVSTLANFNADPNFASSNIGQDGFAQTLSIIVRPKPQNSWVTDTAVIYTGQAPQAPVYGTLNVTSAPSNAAVYIDGRYAGQTPLRYGTTTGNHSVEVRAEGYYSSTQTVNVIGGRNNAHNVQLSPQVQNGTVNFTSRPQGAQVFVDGQYVGVTPTGPVSLTAGTHQVRFSLQGYGDINQSVNVTANSNQTLNADIRPLTGNLVTRANLGGALIFINGRQIATVTSGTGVNTITDLPAGEHELVVIASGFRTHLSTFTIRGGETTEVRINQIAR